MGINSGSGSARGGYGGAYQEDEEGTSDETSVTPPQTSENPVKTNAIESRRFPKDTDLFRRLRIISSTALLGFFTFAGVTFLTEPLNRLDYAYYRPTHFRNTSYEEYCLKRENLNAVGAGLIGLGLGSMILLGAAYRRGFRKREDYPSVRACAPASDDDATSVNEPEGHRGSMSPMH